MSRISSEPWKTDLAFGRESRVHEPVAVARDLREILLTDTAPATEVVQEH